MLLLPSLVYFCSAISLSLNREWKFFRKKIAKAMNETEMVFVLWLLYIKIGCMMVISLMWTHFVLNESIMNLFWFQIIYYAELNYIDYDFVMPNCVSEVLTQHYVSVKNGFKVKVLIVLKGEINIGGMFTFEIIRFRDYVNLFLHACE